MASLLAAASLMRSRRRSGRILVVSDETIQDRDTGAVRSVQRAEVSMPESALLSVWSAEGLERLARTYWRFLARITLGLVHVDYGHRSRSVVLISAPLRLLEFAAPEYEMQPERGLVRWQIRGGLLVAPIVRRRGGDGHLEIEVRRLPETRPGWARVHVKVEVSSFYPAIAFALSRRLYDQTQSRIHVIITRAFLRSLARGTVRSGVPRLAVSKVGRLARS